jgi:signal transduction histidine kinase/CRP-like cAMP-binding protein
MDKHFTALAANDGCHGRIRPCETSRDYRKEALRQCGAFADLDEAALSVIAEEMEACPIEPGTLLFEQGQQAQFLYIIHRGCALMFLPWGDEELPLVTLGPGDLFGEADYFENSERGASAKGLEAGECLRLPFDSIPGLFQRVPQLYPKFMAQRLSETSRRFRQSLQRSRVAERSLRHMNEFLDLSDMSAIDGGSEGLIKRIVHMASKVMKADRASLFLLDPHSGELWSKVAQGEGTRRITIPRGKGLAGHALTSQQILNIDDVYQDPRFNQATDQQTGYRTQTMLCGPVKSVSGQCVGVIQVINKLVGTFTEDDVSLFRAFSHQAAVAVENFHLFSQLRHSNERMLVMLDVLKAVTSTPNLPALIGKVIEKTITIMACERASFFVLDHCRNELWSLKAVGDELEEIRFPAQRGIGGHCAMHNTVINVTDAYQDTRFNPEIDQRTGFKTRNLLACPVCDADGRVVGVVEGINKIGRAFDTDDEDLIVAIASQIGEALKKAALLEELQRSNHSLTSSNLNLEHAVNERTRELKAANKRLQTSNAALKDLNERKSEFLGIAAHDLRNPMANISQLADILMENASLPPTEALLAPEQQTEFIEMIRTSAKAMLTSLDDLMNSESLDSGSPQLNLQSVEISEALRLVVDMNQPNAKRKSIHLSLTLPDEPLRIQADPSRLREVLDNLISNAVKYSPEGKRVWISLKPLSGSQKRVQISVKDEGPGMQAADLASVFGKFKKLSARPTGGESSSGLGLYIVKKLVELHGGCVWVESIYGQGATFYVEFPA